MPEKPSYKELEHRFKELEKGAVECNRVERAITEESLPEIAIQQEAEHLRGENIGLKSSIKEQFGDIIGKSPVMQKSYELILKAAATNAAVAIYGESGTGKELVAQAIHDASNRRDRAFVPVNCGAIAETLLESEFFGYKKGAFTGAHMDRDEYGIRFPNKWSEVC